MKKLLEKIRARLHRRTTARQVTVGKDGIVITPFGGNSVSILWSGIREVVALKHDLLAVDEICLGFGVDGSREFIWSGEDDAGFSDLRIEVERRFAIDPGWFGKVAQPPFAENYTVLWKSNGVA